MYSVTLTYFWRSTILHFFLFLWNGKNDRKNVWEPFIDFDIWSQILNFYMSEIVRARTETWKTTVEFDICHRMVSLRTLYNVTLTFLLKEKHLICYISEFIRYYNNLCEAFIDFDICHRMVLLRKLTYFLTVKHFKFVYLWKGKN